VAVRDRKKGSFVPPIYYSKHLFTLQGLKVPEWKAKTGLVKGDSSRGPNRPVDTERGRKGSGSSGQGRGTLPPHKVVRGGTIRYGLSQGLRTGGRLADRKQLAQKEKKVTARELRITNQSRVTIAGSNRPAVRS